MFVGLADRFGRHASERTLAAIFAGTPEPAHVAGCAVCQARLAELRGWAEATASEAAAIADAVFTADRLATQKQQVLARLEAAGRSARVIAFPLGTTAPAATRATQAFRWAAVAAAGILVGVASARLLDPHTTPPATPQIAGSQTPGQGPVAAADRHDDAALLDEAYDRISLDSLQTIDDMTPRVREVALVSVTSRR